MHERLLIVQNGRRRVSAHSRPLRHGAEGNEQTLRYAAAMVREDSAQDDRLRALAEMLAASCAARDVQCEVEKLFEFTRDRIRYVEDPPDTERIADGWTTLEELSGDCGDKSILLASLLGSLGYRSQFIVQNWRGDVFDHGYDHVHLEVVMPEGSTVELDPTNEHADLGWEAPDQQRARFPIWSEDANHATGVSGLFDQLLPGLIQQGIQVGSQIGQAKIQQSRITQAQEAQVNSQWNALTGQALSVVQSISARLPNITADDYALAQQWYQGLEQFAAQHGSEYVTRQWNDPSYKAAFQSDLNRYQHELASPQNLVSVLPPGTTATTTSVSSQSWWQSLIENPLVPIAGIAALVLLLKRS